MENDFVFKLDLPLKPGTYGAEFPEGPGVKIVERHGLQLLHLAGDFNNSIFPTFVRSALGLPLPQVVGEIREGTGIRILWLAPNRWLVVSETSLNFDQLEGIAAINNLSGGRTTLRLSGRNVRDLLQKGCPVDLNPKVFTAGHAYSTLLGQINIIIDCIAADVFDVYVSSSYDQFFRIWLVEAALEFGVQIANE